MTPEKKVEEHIKKQLDKQSAYWVKTWGGTYSKKGVPDMLCCIQGHFIALELKRPTGGKPTPVQIKNLYQIAQNDGIALITNDPNVDQVLAHLFTNTINNNDHLHQITLDESSLPQLRPEEAAKIWQQFHQDGSYTVQICAKDSD